MIKFLLRLIFIFEGKKSFFSFGRPGARESKPMINDTQKIKNGEVVYFVITLRYKSSVVVRYALYVFKSTSSLNTRPRVSHYWTHSSAIGVLAFNDYFISLNGRLISAC